MTKKLVWFLTGLMLLVMMFIALFFTGAIYDTAQKRTIDVYFFQPNPRSDMRPGEPRAIDKIKADQMLSVLIRRYVTEYFYVLPDRANVDGREKSGALKLNSVSTVFNQWQTDVMPELRRLAAQGTLRTVTVTNIVEFGDYYAVEYEFNTWTQPNNMNERPEITRGAVLLKIWYQPGIFKAAEEQENELRRRVNEQNYDLVGAFQFVVHEVIQQ